MESKDLKTDNLEILLRVILSEMTEEQLENTKAKLQALKELATEC